MTELDAEPRDSGLLRGRLLKYHSNYYYVIAEETLYECFSKGNLKKEGQEILVGDQVWLDSVDVNNATARIHSVLPRETELKRPKVANIDTVLIVHPLKQPDFSYAQLDRYLVHVEMSGLTPVICLSKSDLLLDEAERANILRVYQDGLGYEVYFTSILNPALCEPIGQRIQGKVSVVAGVSGAGKSSLLNTLNPTLGLRVQEVSEKIGRGQHTTRHVELLEVSAGTYVADTPGFSNLKFTEVMPETIRGAFPELCKLAEACEFKDCLHQDETGCAVLPQVGEDVAQSRMDSYNEMLSEARQYVQTVQNSSQKQEYGVKTLHKKGKQGLQIIKLKEKQRESSRRQNRQDLKTNWEGFSEDDESG